MERLYDSTFYLLSRLLDRYIIYISTKNWVKKFFDFKNFSKISLTILPKNPIQTRSFQNKITNYNRYPLEIPKHQIRERKKTSLTLRLPRFQIILKTSSDRIFLFPLFQKKRNQKREKGNKERAQVAKRFRQFRHFRRVIRRVLILGGVAKRKNDGRNAATFQTVGRSPVRDEFGTVPGKGTIRNYVAFAISSAHTRTHVYIDPH